MPEVEISGKRLHTLDRRGLNTPTFIGDFSDIIKVYTIIMQINKEAGYSRTSHSEYILCVSESLNKS